MFLRADKEVQAGPIPDEIEITESAYAENYNIIRAAVENLQKSIEVPVSQFLGIFFALLNKKKTRFGHVCEVIYFLPMLISMVVASVLISYILSNNGPLNMLFQVLGMKPISWLNGRFSAKMAVMILELWKGGMPLKVS